MMSILEIQCHVRQLNKLQHKLDNYQAKYQAKDLMFHLDEMLKQRGEKSMFDKKGGLKR